MFLKKFQGQYVEIVTKRDMLTEMGNAPLMVYGFIVDMDNEFLYLGENPIQIARALSKADISLIEVADPELQEENEMMEMIGNGENEDDSNLN